MDELSFQLALTKPSERFKKDRYFVNIVTGELAFAISEEFLPKGRGWVRITKQAYFRLEKNNT